MPDQEISFLDQKALVWGSVGFDNYGVRTVQGAAEEIPVRWQSIRSQGTDAEGNVVSYDAAVMTDRFLPVGSVLWLGSLFDLNDATAGTSEIETRGPPDNLYEVVNEDESPDLKARATQRTLRLQRLTNTVPRSG